MKEEGPPTIAIWYEALASFSGIIITDIDNIELYKQALYKLRDQAQDPELYSISVRVPPSDADKQLWLVKKERKNEEKGA